MLEVSRALNPECSTWKAICAPCDSRQFDVVFIHDAIDYMTSAHDPRKALETAFAHCRAGGAALFTPDHVRETFRPSTDHGGHDGDGRAFRYLEWTYDPDETDTTYVVEFAYLLREAGQPVRFEHEQHICGLFPRALWLEPLSEVGFQAQVVGITMSVTFFWRTGRLRRLAPSGEQILPHARIIDIPMEVPHD
jgi:hypothetical protein